MKKYRVKQKGNRYYAQAKGLLFWNNLITVPPSASSTTLLAISYGYVPSYKTLGEAWAAIEAYKKATAHNATKIHECEEDG